MEIREWGSQRFSEKFTGSWLDLTVDECIGVAAPVDNEV